ncbi:hypothetical protein TS15_19035 [Salmonella enterica]|nr:hypothetical protein [Salmonella enterica]MII10600.1 hypothetical protein [Salmonella enterica]
MQSHIRFIECVLNTLNKVKRKHKFLDDKCLVMYSPCNIMSDSGFFLSAKTNTDILPQAKKFSVL